MFFNVYVYMHVNMILYLIIYVASLYFPLITRISVDICYRVAVKGDLIQSVHRSESFPSKDEPANFKGNLRMKIQSTAPVFHLFEIISNSFIAYCRP